MKLDDIDKVLLVIMVILVGFAAIFGISAIWVPKNIITCEEALVWAAFPLVLFIIKKIINFE